jgi:hypothetical protein
MRWLDMPEEGIELTPESSRTGFEAQRVWVFSGHLNSLNKFGLSGLANIYSDNECQLK